MLIVPLLLLAGTARAQDTWTYLLETDLTSTQAYYSDSWTGGETGNVSWVWNLNSIAEKQLSASLHNRNVLRLKYGQTHTQDQETGDWRSPVKSDDLIDFESILRLTMIESFDPYAGVRFESQFYDAGDPEKARYVNPMRITESVGLARVLIEGEERKWLIRLGAATRQYIDRERLDPVTMERETSTEYDGGLMFDSDIRLPLADGSVVYTGKLNVYQALVSSEADELEGLPAEDYWKMTDVRFENSLSVNVTGHILVSLYVDFRYDKEIDLRGRFKQTLGLGINYRFGNMES